MKEMRVTGHTRIEVKGSSLQIIRILTTCSNSDFRSRNNKVFVTVESMSSTDENMRRKQEINSCLTASLSYKLSLWGQWS